MEIRKPVVAGQFYPETKKALDAQLISFINPSSGMRDDAVGVVSPHAGYIYSGRVAVHALGSIKAKSTYIIMGPNHTGLGAQFGLCNTRMWSTPLGDVEVDIPLADKILKDCKYINGDTLSHKEEHSVEVQIPILQFLYKKFKIVPIIIGQASPDVYTEIGRDIADSIKSLGMEKDVVLVASSDMTHYESQNSAKTKDTAAINAILELDEGKLVKVVSELDISMCGYAPVSVMIAASKALGASRAKLVDYRTSGDVTGDFTSVVGYAGIVVL